MRDLRYGVHVPHLRAVRTSRLLSQARLAHQAHVDRGTVINAEKGLPIKPMSMGRLAKALKVDWRTLVEGDGNT